MRRVPSCHTETRRGTAEVYILRAPDNTFFARTLVEHKDRNDTSAGARVSYGELTGMPTFQQIEVGEHILLFNQVPVSSQEVLIERLDR